MTDLAQWLRGLFGKQPELMTLNLPSPGRSLGSVGEIVRARRAAVQRVPASDLAHYRAVIKTLPRPTDAQIENFVQFVSEAHSWYKHLPLLPPGTTFRFYVDPSSGCDRVVGADGNARYRERTEGTPRFHYTWMTTSDYRRRFGHLAYDAAAGNMFVIPTAGGALEYAERPLFVDGHTAYRIPEEVDAAGSVQVTAVVHPLTARIWVWENVLPTQGSVSWPIETGGDETLEAIRSVCRRAAQRNARVTDEIDPDLVALLEPEKRRLQLGMKIAIRRVVDLVYD